MDDLDLSPLARALDQLESAFAYASRARAGSDAALAVHLRAGAIQAFEFSYELSVRMLKRHLDIVESTPGAGADFADLVRLGYGRGLLAQPVGVWREFRRRRGVTSHTYDEAKAEEIFCAIPQFLQESRHLLTTLQARTSEP